MMRAKKPAPATIAEVENVITDAAIKHEQLAAALRTAVERKRWQLRDVLSGQMDTLDAALDILLERRNKMLKVVTYNTPDAPFGRPLPSCGAPIEAYVHTVRRGKPIW